MLNEKTIAVVVPAYNEESQIGMVIETMPEFVDLIVIVNDCSKDKTHDKVVEYIESGQYPLTLDDNRMTLKPIEATIYNRAEIISREIDERQELLLPKHSQYKGTTSKIILIDNIENAKVGGAIAIGYSWCRMHGIDCTAVMAGDGQMDPDELEDICMPVICGEADYVKGNRLSHKSAVEMIPRVRFFGNSVLSALTKIASGYWRVSDTQTGYTAISLDALEKIELHKIYPTYGMPNDMLVKLNIAKCTLKEIPIKPVYDVGEKSKMKIGKVIPRISLLLIKGFIERIVKKYFLRDFHPIFLFYLLSFFSNVLAIYFLVYIIRGLLLSAVTTGTYLGFVLFFLIGQLASGLAMWLDIYDNDRLWIQRT